jgi:hypothetical protein
MGKSLLLSFVLMCFGAALLSAQGQETNPGHAPSVFMGGPKNKKDKKATSRLVRGTVTDTAGRPRSGALVTLTNKGNNDKLTFVTKADGLFNFDDLSFTTDYELDARYKTMVSETKILSQYDRRVEIVRTLEVGPNTSEAAAEKKEAAQAVKK